ncbi:carbohydrate ABC transporter ATP-binding protein (CUT1 family) [Chelatococcus asaccharovorans]|uniref:Carbohydrate ABC transporter ATP-binding protein (CUT1 family) n=2 Tax=Chelatococcus asaccharovorans TaxID=28210 RepID=A0A2V3TRQ3_9HYPH|nr:carbohydrate ABC transporter ATP-binding protein (CUT1 family) [Chelatococcus asaccharovorans]
MQAETQTMSCAGAAIQVRDLRVAYGGTPVLHGVSLDFAPGTFTALLGSSGCGKTTLLRSLCGFVPVTSGAILVGNRDVAPLPPEKRGMAMVFQSYALWPHMTVLQNMGYGLRLRGKPKAEIVAKVAALLAMLGLTGYEERKVTALSGGQRQRVALGRALAIDPGILLLDEPLSNLDAKIRMTMRHEIRAIQQRLGVTAIHVTHDREEAMTMADRLVIMQAGRVAQVGSPEEVYDRPASAFVANFMGAENVLPLHVERTGAGTAITAGGAVVHLTNRDAPAHPTGEAVAYFRDDVASLDAPDADPRGDLLVPGLIVARSYPGGLYRYRVEAAGRQITVDDATRHEPGVAVSLRIPTERLHIFPAAEAALAA